MGRARCSRSQDEVARREEGPGQNLRGTLEGHPASRYKEGVDFLVSQFYFENALFFDFVERARSAGITIPIVPGIMPIASVAGIRRMAGMNGTSFPAELARALDRVDGDEEATYRLGVEWATMQCRELLDRGVPGIHFFTLNRSPASREIHRNLFGG